MLFVPTGLWRGSAVTLVRDWPSFGVYFAVYEGMQEVLSPGSRQSNVIHPLALLTAGMMSYGNEHHHCERFEYEHTCWNLKDGDLCLSRGEPEETLMQAHRWVRVGQQSCLLLDVCCQTVDTANGQLYLRSGSLLSPTTLFAQTC